MFNTKGRGWPLVRIRDVALGSTSTFYDGPFAETSRVETGDLLIGMDGDFKVAAWRGPPALLNQRVCRLDVDEARYDRRFLGHVLQGYLDAINRETSAVTVKHLSSRTVAAIPLPMPPLDEQHRIVAVVEDHLSRLDAAESYLVAANKRLDELRRPRALGAGSVPLGAVLLSARYGTSTKCTYRTTGVPVVRIPNVASGRLCLDDLKRADDDVDVSSYVLEEGDVLVIRSNGSVGLVGRMAVVPPQATAVAYASYLIRLKVNTAHLHPDWLRYVSMLPSVRRQIESAAASSAGQHNLNLATLRSLRVPLPSLAEQERMLADARDDAEVTGRLGQGIHVGQQRAAGLRRSLLTAAFSGRL